mmetsp:Transcript_62811/g.203535  ORF Transcript_62811/g.203535 Transcript_62811/m.203535 type:complete len:316 (-) Transcript_62811:1-948(-)
MPPCWPCLSSWKRCACWSGCGFALFFFLSRDDPRPPFFLLLALELLELCFLFLDLLPFFFRPRLAERRPFRRERLRLREGLRFLIFLSFSFAFSLLSAAGAEERTGTGVGNSATGAARASGVGSGLGATAAGALVASSPEADASSVVASWATPPLLRIATLTVVRSSSGGWSPTTFTLKGSMKQQPLDTASCLPVSSFRSWPFDFCPVPFVDLSMATSRGGSPAAAPATTRSSTCWAEIPVPPRKTSLLFWSRPILTGGCPGRFTNSFGGPPLTETANFIVAASSSATAGACAAIAAAAVPPCGRAPLGTSKMSA